MAGARADRRLGPGAGYLLPSLELRHPDGTAAPLWAWRGRGPLVVYLHAAGAPASQAHLERVLALEPQLVAAGARLLVVTDAPLDQTVPWLLDAAGRLAARLRHDAVLAPPVPPGLLVVGRTGEVWVGWPRHGGSLPEARELLDWVEYALAECRECFCCEQVWPAE